MSKIKLKKLTQFYCDECGEIIEKPEDGFVEWEDELKEKINKRFVRGFRIVHRKTKSPFRENREGCFKYGNSKYRSDDELSNFIKYKLQRIYSLLDLGFMHDSEGDIGCRVENMKEFVDFAKRLTIPHYEEARKYFQAALDDGYFSDMNEIKLFSESSLKSIIEKYSTSE